jgi:hypothetical protein
MALYLPRNLAALATVAAKENPRYAVTGVRVLDPDDGTYRLEATDGRRLAIVRGSCLPEQECPELQAAPNGATAAVVPRDDWQRAFKLAKGKDREPVVGFAASTDRFTFVSQGQVLTGTPQEGRWPPVDAVLPTRGPLVQFRVDPTLLASLLEVAGALGMEAVEVLYYGKGKPLGLVAHNDAGQFFDGLIMPLSPA